MFFTKSGKIFHYMSLFQGYELYYRQMVAQFCINKVMCTVHKLFLYFVHPL